MAESQVDVTFSGQDVAFDVRTTRVQSAISAPFSIQLTAVSELDDVDLDALVGSDAKMSLTLPGGLMGSTRLDWSGICSAAELLSAETGRLSTYALTIAPKLWLLTLRRNYRIFQRKNALDVVTTILDQWAVPHVETDVDATALPKLDYRVQHGESDFAFVSRMLEEAGISYYFRTGDSGSQMFLTDRPQQADRTGEPIPFRAFEAFGEPHVWQVHRATSARFGSIVLQDYDFRQPNRTVDGSVVADTADSPTQPSEADRELYEYAPGRSVVVGDADGDYPMADQGGAARPGADAFTAMAKRRLEGQRLTRKRVNFTTSAVQVTPGVVTAISGHARSDLGPDKKLLVLSTVLEGGEPGGYRVNAQAVFAEAPFHPQPVTPRPVAPGLVTARVVGPSGQEIHTDEFGRVRVQFPWDRIGQNDEHSSCWIRVSQGWAGTGYGTILLPRIGQEVLVGFLGGDPDQPIIVGRLYNATQQVPYTLPDSKDVSGWKSNSTPGSDGFNELRFEDAKGQEQVYLQAQRDMTAYVKHDQTERTDHDRTIVVKNNLTKNVDVDESERTGGNRVRVVEGNEEVRVEKNQTVVNRGKVTRSTTGTLDEVVTGDAKTQYGGDRNVIVGGADKELVTGKKSITAIGGLHVMSAADVAIQPSNFGVNAGGDAVIEAGTVCLKGAGGFITIDASGVTIVGTIVKINSGGAAVSGPPCSPDSPSAPSNAGQVTSTSAKYQPRTPGEPSPGGAAQPPPGGSGPSHAPGLPPPGFPDLTPAPASSTTFPDVSVPDKGNTGEGTPGT
jgi:type VI secretion system secreted protein VgrG